MRDLTQKERLLRALRREVVDRPPLVCPGGMVSLAIGEAMDASGCAWPQAHVDAAAMAGLALAMYDLGGIENLAVPFCMTVEAEALGAPVELGDRLTQPRITQEPYRSAAEVLALQSPQIADSPRAQTVLAAMRTMARERPETPVIGNLTGPVSLLASLVQPDLLLREMLRRPKEAAQALEALTERLVQFGIEQVRAGAEVIAIADPTATGEILGPRLFGQLAVPPLARLTAALHAQGCLVIVHICGKVSSIVGHLAAIGADAISVDDVVKLSSLREHLPNAAIMGNLSTFVLREGPVEKIGLWVERIGRVQADIIAPACAVVPNTPLAHVQALAEAVKRLG
jgi:[methyl-Co(III) methanol-specific corrinoid protein]:coenzyme M methyltransferase